MRKFLNHPVTRVVMMLWCSVLALSYATQGTQGWAYTMIACACWWLFRVWEGLREEQQDP